MYDNCVRRFSLIAVAVLAACSTTRSNTTADHSEHDSLSPSSSASVPQSSTLPPDALSARARLSASPRHAARARLAPRPRARPRAARGMAARAARGHRDFGRHRGRTQRVANGSACGDRSIAPGARRSWRAPVDRAVVLAHARAGEPRARGSPRSRGEAVARIRHGKARRSR